MKKLGVAALSAVATLSALPAFAVGTCPPGQTCGASVPEISALSGTAALAAVAAVVLLVWERSRRRRAA